jgi:hypothetical protein
MSAILKHWEKTTLVPEAITYAATIAPAMANRPDRSIFTCTLTGDITVNVPTGGRAGQELTIIFTASGAERDVALHADILTPALAGAGAIGTGKKALLRLAFTGTEWFLVSYQLDA